jgi:hypothetical protein
MLGFLFWRVDLRTWQWDWLGWQVVTPILGPILVSAAVVSLWQMGPRSFPIDWSIVCDDVSPWALSFYCVTLICVTMHDFWPEISKHPVLGGAMIVVAFAVAVYASFIVVWRHDTTFHPGTKLWQIAFVFLVTVVALCHRAVADLENKGP